jgi:hypothetical protein
MRDQRLERVKFRYQLNHLTFECLFFADTVPFELVMGCLGLNFAIFVDVHQGFVIRPFIEPEQTYWALRDALFMNAGSGVKLEASWSSPSNQRPVACQALEVAVCDFKQSRPSNRHQPQCIQDTGPAATNSFTCSRSGLASSASSLSYACVAYSEGSHARVAIARSRWVVDPMSLTFAWPIACAAALTASTTR